MALDVQIAVLLAALAIDAVLGDPDVLWKRLPHPVVLFGRAIAVADRRLNDPALPEPARRRRGITAILALLAAAVAAGAASTAIALALPAGEALIALLAAILIAHRSLIDHVMRVADGLAGGLEGGREAVRHIVGRDPDLLDGSGVAGAAIESAAENFSDGVVAPAFWFALAGLPGLFAYKMLNTADSMIGHRTPRHGAFGWASARLDDLANLVPARLSALVILLAAWPGAARLGRRLRIVIADAPGHRSPNAGWPEAAVAASLGIALGGPRRYAGVGTIDGAWLNGGGRRQLEAGDIARTCRLLDRAAVLQGGLYGAVLAGLVLS